ncbi:A-kinase anchor protein 9 isoform X4 [Ahaetulla prasina]|uniref:A-kinase anchor protein 9 isoform X4 n=1 Tax=Ahaetulla prasina TaxID=499056 RepID=UPI0026494C2B|nr:A-kinase anchor protein 9 isoform X4 [Ahaetulla prasina]
MDEQERQKKLEAGKAKLAQFRQRKAYTDGQHAFKKQKKKKKISKVKDEELIQEGLDINQLQIEEASPHSFQRGAAAASESVAVRTLQSDEMIKHDQTYTTELESEISTPADDYSSEINGGNFLTRTDVPSDFIREEELEFGEKYTDHEVQNTVTELEMMKNELAGKQQEIEELNKELEEMRAAYGTDGLQQLQEFETAIKKRDNIITQLTANLQQARMEKDETMREFLELTEQSQKLQIQFQHLQASETLRNSSHSSTAADLLQARQQIFAYQQQLEDQEQLLRNYQKKNEDFEVQVSLLQHKIMDMEKWKDEEDCSTKKKIHEQQTTIEQLEAKCTEHEENIFLYLKKLSIAEKSLQELKEETFQKNQELGNVKLELTISKQKERQCSDEIKQLMGTVEELQKRFHKDIQHENDIKEKMELEAQRKLADLRAELEEMHGQQIVQLKQELIREHSIEMKKLLAQQKADLEKVCSDKTNEDQMHLMNTAINELNQMLQDANYQKEKVKQELTKQVELLSLEKSSFQNQVEDLCQELSFAREQIQRVKKTINEKESKLQEVDMLKSTIGDLKAQLASASEIRKELEMKHEAEITNYKIKLEMLEKEKDAVLDRMAESQEAELERLRTQLLFSHEEELSKVKDDLQIGHKINIENLKDNMTMQAKQQLDDLQNEMNKKLEAMQFEKDSLIKNQNQLTLEIARLRDLPTVNTNSEEMMLLVNNFQEEIDVLRQEEKKKCILEQEIQELQLKTELLEKQMKEQSHCLQEKYLLVEAQNNVLEGENKVLQDRLNKCTIRNVEGNLVLTSDNSNSEEFDLQNRIDKLIAENEKLVQQDIKQKEEIDILKNSFSLAEINFNHNYQELQENYACLLKVKLDLEESKDKNEAEYKTKLQALMEKIQHLQGVFPAGLETQNIVVHSKREKVLKDFGEVIEKDTTELMEKLELSQHENLELSLRLSDLSEQLKIKHHQICQLNAEVMCLKQDKEQISARCKELEFVISHKLENMNSFEEKTENCSGELAKVNEPGNFISDFNQKFDRTIKEKEEKLIPSELLAHSIPVEEILQQKLSPEPESLLDNFNQMHEITGDSVCMNFAQSENKLKEQLDMLKTEQNDLKLQMEAQRICLSVVYSAHMNQVREYMENEKENALSALKEDLQLRHTQELCELKKSQIVDNQKTDEKDQSAWVHLEELSKKVVEECSKLTKSVREILPEPFSNATELDVDERNQYNSALMPTEDPQVLQETLQSLLNNIMETSERLLEYQVEFIESRKKMEDQQTSHVDYNDKETGSIQQNVESLPIASQDLVGIKVKTISQEEVENLKFQLEEQHAQEIEHLRSYFHQQLKETEEKYFTEIVHQQNRLQIASESSENSSVSVESHVNEDKQEARQAEGDIQKNAEKIIELPNEADVTELLEKQYQEKLLQEVAKVVVTMSIEFAQKTELARIVNLKKEEISLMKPIETQLENNYHRKEYLEELNSHINEKSCTKPEELCGKMSSLEGQFELDAKQATLYEVQHFNPKLSTYQYSSSHEEEFIEKIPMVLSYEDRLEDMRQELVRQYQEHQQATEILKQSHMQQMERQKENQELLLTELDSLKIQLAENINENAITEREQMLLDELESLKKQLIAGREKQLSELKNSSTQTQNESVNQTENKEHVLKVEGGEEKDEQTSLNILSKERCTLQKASSKLMKILLDIVKTTAAVEETIGHLVVKLLDQSPKSQFLFKSLTWEARAEGTLKPSIYMGYEPERPSSQYIGNDLESQDNIIWSEITDEEFELTQFLGMEIDAKNGELILNINSRLQAVFEKLLQTINETANQQLDESKFSKETFIIEQKMVFEKSSGPLIKLEHAKATQTELMQESFKWEHEATELTKCQEELQERFDEEVRTREQIALELSKAENLIDGYADEKSLMEKQMQEKTEVIEHLEQELLRTGNKLQELEAERQHLQEEKELLFRQKDAMKADAGPIEKRLVHAAVNAASQTELLAETEKLMKEKIEVQRQAEKEYNYLQKQVKALETDIEEQVNQFLELEQEKNAELMDLRQQNQALEKQLEKTKKFLDEQAIDREHERDVFQQEIQKLEQQLKIPQRFQPVSEHQNREVEELTNNLQEKTDKCSELLLSKEQLQRDVQERNEEIEKLECRIQELEQALMISADNIQKVEGRKKFGSATIRGDLPLEVQLQAEQEAVDRKEKEIINLEEQLEQFREELENKNEEVQQLQMQLQIQLKESTTRQQELEQENKLFKEDMKQLGQAIQNPEDTSIKGHHQVPGKYIEIIQEKDKKIHELQEQISKLQQQMEITTDNKQKNEQIKELEAQIEILKSDQERVKQNNEQEIEQLNEVIEKLQQEMVNIEHKIPLDFSLTQDDFDNLKHQLDVVLAEKEDLVIQVKNNVKQLCVAENELEEKQINIVKLEKELGILKEELEKTREKSEQNINICQQQDAQINTKIEEDASRTNINFQLLEKALEEKDLELIQCNKDFKDFKDQAHMASNKLKQRIMELEEALEQKEQKIAVTLQHQGELNVVLEQSQLSPVVAAVSEGNKEEALCIPLENEKHIGREDATTRLLELSEKLAEMQSQLADAQNNLQLERTKLEIVQKETKEKEERLVELKQLLKEIEQRHKEEKLSSSQEKLQTQVVTELDENKQRNYLALEKVRAESAAAKEELNNYKEKAEKLKEQLLVKETNLICLKNELEQTRDKLAQAEEKISGYIKKEKNIIKPEQIDARWINASSQTEKAQQISSCNQTSQLLVKSEGIQIDLQNEYSSAEVTELIKEFNEKIEQMQELHAAEIMDMETRHISESEVLKREQFIAVQELTEECNTLKNVIDVLRNKEAIPGIAQSLTSVANDRSYSDSASDWNQGTYLTPNHGSETISDAVEEEDETTMDFLPKKIKGLLRAIHHEGVQVLSLTEFPYNEGEVRPTKQEPWLEERKAFLSSISSLKELIAKMQIHRQSKFYVASESSDDVSDWRAELLYAVQQIFQKEKDILLAAFRTELAEVGVQDALVLIDQMERRLQEQVTYQRSALDFLQKADRQSLLMETNILHAQLNRQGEEKEEIEIHPKYQELLGYNMEMQIELKNIKDRTAELQEQLNSERMVVAELKNELGQTKLELETTLKAQHKHLRDLEAIRNELKGKATELDILKNTIINEQKKSREFQWALEKEKAKVEHSGKKEKEEMEDLKSSFENERQKNIELSNLLELERELSNDLQKKIESQEALNAVQLSEEHSCNSELQVLLESERLKVLELCSALEREKDLRAQLQMIEQTKRDGSSTHSEELFKDLQKQLDEKHNRIVLMVNELEENKLECVKLKQQLEKEKQIQRKTLQAEQDANILAQKKIHELESRVEDLQWRLEEERQQVLQLLGNEKKQQEMVEELQQKIQRKEVGLQVEKATCQAVNEVPLDESNERTRKWIFQQKMGQTETKELSYSSLMGIGGGGGDASRQSQELEMVRQKLKNVFSKLKHLASKAACRLPFEKSDDEDLIGIQTDIEEILLKLQVLSDLYSLEINSDSPSSASLTERLLKQNAELTGFVSRLSEEKNNMRNTVMKLEEELRRYQYTGSCGTFRQSLHNGKNVDALIASEKEIWHKEKLSLQQSLKQAETELAKLKAELRNEAFLRELGSDSENAALKRVYGRYLRAESFRKALIYQKKYLLLLLGGFQECEEATLTLIARMGGQPSYTQLEVITHHSKSFTRFRSAARVLIAISRMKFLVRRWKRVTGYHLIGVNRDSYSQNTGNELRSDSFSGSLELCGEHRAASYRSRSELESLRSPFSYQQSPVSLACYQLQNYDPDRALSDYINRLESLQRRLGNVQPASASQTQLHSALRR